MNLLKEIAQKFNVSESKEVLEILNRIDAARLCSSKREIQSALIILSRGNIESLKGYQKLVYKKEGDILNAAKVIGNEVDHTGDIHIGENQYIKWIPFNDNLVCLNIDDELQPTQIFWGKLATECHFECCGIGACDFHSEGIINAARRLKDDQLITKWKALIEKINALDCDVIGTSFLNQNCHRTVFLKLLVHIEKHIVTANGPIVLP